MSQAAPPSDKTDKRDSSPSTPPDERFWQRYSPHAEFPLSSAGSFLAHLLVFGLLALMAWLGVALFGHANRSLPVEAVRIVGGGGGDPNGQVDGSGGSAPVEAGAPAKDPAAGNVLPEDAPTPTINVDPTPQAKPKFEDQPGRQIKANDTESNAFASLRQKAGRIRSPSDKPAARGKGGNGEGGGQGSGKGSGIGSGSGNGPPANLTQREKRQLRWSMLFNTIDSADYVAQLQGLGAVLAFPIRENGNDFEYRIVRNLTPGHAKLLNEDIQKIQAMIRWIDDKPRNAIGVMTVLGLPQPKISPDKLHFIACLPEKLEKKLLDLELGYLQKRSPGRSEDDIYETKFKINVQSGKYKPEVYQQTLK